jgi:tripartite-type tricarboxylate transporter receptor subunit TctC
MPYDTFRDLVPVGLAAMIPLVLVASQESQIKTVQDLLAAAKARPGQLTYATTGIGGGQHLAMEQFQQLAGVRLTHVPYKGVAAGLQDVAAGRVTLMLASPSTAMPFIRDARLVPVAYASSARMAQLPNVATFAEQGFPNFEPSGWMGLMVPRGAPAAVVEKISADLRRVATGTAYAEAIGRAGNEARYSTPAELAARIRREHDAYGQVIKSLNLKN